MIIKTVTIWERKMWKKIKGEKVLVTEFNHIEDGWDFKPKPIPHSTLQKRAWKDATWIKTNGYLDENNKGVKYE